MSITDDQEPQDGRGIATNRRQDEASVLGTVVTALAALDQDARQRIFRTLATFYDLSLQHHGLGSASRLAPEPGAATPQSTNTGPAFSEDRTPTPKAFLLEKKPQTDVDRITCLAYYLTHYRDQAFFKTLELSKLNTEAAQVKFANAARAVDNAAAAHFLIPAGQGKKQLSAIGEVYVQALPDRSAARLAASEHRQRRSRTKNKTKVSSSDESGTEAEERNDQ